jgi:ABC-type multidrug transport system ATPase subunit
MTNTILEVKGLTKQFGKLTAVDNLDLVVEKGEVFGILGPNGSGKTTTLGMLLDVIAPSSGSYNWFEGQKPSESRKKIGSILETPCFYPYLDAEQNLKIAAHIKQCNPSRIDEVLDMVNLLDRKHDKFKGYSLGMKQRLSIAAALLADPPVLILDEPTNGLDPEGIAEVRKLIRDIAAKGKTILIASHLLDEVQKVCTEFIILRKGQKLHEGRVDDILGDKNEIEIQAADKEKLTSIMQNYDKGSIASEMPRGLLITLHEGGTSEDVNSYCFENGLALTQLIVRKRSLEEEFLKILNEY